MRFDQTYNQQDFLNFLGTFLPDDFVEKEEDIVIKKDRYKEITKARILGFSESLDLHVLEMDHGHENDPRIAIATDAFKVLADHWVHKALVVFKNKDSENYRLSYLTISLDLNDKNKAVKRYSNARRYSFYLGVNAKIRTPEQQLIKKGKVKDAEDLLSRFSVEVVNKQFYLEVAKFFDELVSSEDQNLTLPSVSHSDINTRKSFAVRLIGRTMFCWFLKQKKSDNGQLIPDGLLSSKIVTDNYYHSTLEPLFFGVLNTSIESRDIRSDLFDKVPYLNGGLFNPQSDDYYELDRGTFASKHINTLKISDSWFRGFFELLETYNFTIDENTVFDQELSVDPEMLGRIFENLLAEINPETGSSERKRTGSFYTPRQIVEYMVDQSLIEYLKTKTGIEEKRLSALVSYDLTDDTEHPLNDSEKESVINAVESLKILDPACGSGAYPIGALQKIVYVLQQIDPDCKMWLEQKLKGVPELYKQKIINEVKSNPFDYTRKLDVIKNSIFGVDIQPIAVDVSRLRCFLTLVVESEVDDTKPNRGIEPLPNLDFKFVCANTLIGLPKSQSSNLFEDHSGIIELSKIMSEYFSCNSQRKNEIKLKFINLQKEILEKTISAFGKNTGELTLKLTTWSPFSNTSNSWFDPEWMFGLEDKFDVVIGNPPYGVSVKGQDRENIVVSLGKVPDYEIYYYFIEIAKKFLKEKGINSYIIPNTFLFNVFASDYRKNILSTWNIHVLIDCTAFKLFESATVHNAIVVFSKTQNAELVGYKNTLGAESFEDLLKRETLYLSKDEVLVNNTNWGLVFKLPPKIINIISKIKISSIKVSDSFPEISQGLIAYDKHTGQDEEIIKNRSFHHLTKINNSVKEWLWGEDVTPYHVQWNGKEFIDYGAGIANPRLPKYFKGNRILIREITSPKIYAGFTDKESYHDPAIIVVLDNQKNIYLLLGILNSKLATFYHFNSSPKATKGAFPKILVKDINDFPFPNITSLNKDVTEEIESLVTQILALKKVDTKADISTFESQIDRLVYKLYSLTDEEIKTVEQKL